MVVPPDAERGLVHGPVSNPGADRVRLILSVDGMTCAACPAGITRVIRDIDYVTDFSISLLDKACRMILPRDRIEEICEVIEDTGYDVQVVSTESVTDSTEQSQRDHLRTVDLEVSGLFCHECPNRVRSHLMDLDWVASVEVAEYKSSEQVIKLAYTPDPQVSHTIRDINGEIEDLGFRAKLHAQPLAGEIANRKAEAEILKYLICILTSLIVAIPTFVIGIVIMDLAPVDSRPRRYLMGPVVGRLSRGVLALFILATPVEFGLAWVFHAPALRGLRGLWRLHNNKIPIWKRFIRFGSMNLLISLGVTIAYFASLALLIISAREEADGTTEDTTYFDSVVFLTLFILVGRFIEVNSKKKMKDAIALLGELRPQEATLLLGNETHTIPTKMLEIGDKCIVALGSSPPVDGIVSAGSTQFNESSLSGEARPVTKSVGDKIFAGTINTEKQIVMEVTSIDGSNVSDAIAKVISDGTTHRAHIERFGDILTSYFVPVICFISVCVFGLWLGLSYSGVDQADLNNVIFSLRFSISVFVIACPCGIGLAAPTASAVGSAICARLGILASGGSEAYADACKTVAVVFDKTGTLTLGEMKVISSESLDECSLNDEEIWSAVALCEQKSSHPIASAILAFVQEMENFRVLDGLIISDEQEIPGQGMKAKISNGKTSYVVFVGNQAMMKHHGMSSQCTADANATTVFIAVLQGHEETAVAFHKLELSDTVRQEAAEVIKQLKARNMDCFLLTGDQKHAAHHIARQVGINSECVIAEVSPLAKREHLTQLREKYSTKGRVAFVGDGINDAPALAAADVSISLSSASDIAISSASFILINSDLQSILTLIDLSRLIYRRIKFNYGWAIVFNIIAIPIAAGVLYPYHHFVLSPAWASLAMALSSISVVMSSFALKLQAPSSKRTLS